MTQILKVQSYNGAKDNIGNETYAHIAIELIQSGPALQKAIASLREQLHLMDSEGADIKKLEENYEAKKKKLPAVTWSGTFVEATAIKKAEDIKAYMAGKLSWQQIRDDKKYWVRSRKIEQLKDYSGLICIDIDKLSTEKLANIKERLKADKYTFFVFTSPSGLGMKVLVKVQGGQAAHAFNFLALEKYFKHEYQVDIDPSGKDVSRLCFLSYDPNCFINYDSALFAHSSNDTDLPVPAPALSKGEERTFQDADNDLEWIKAFTDKKLTYTEGFRNKYVHLFACNCNRKGIEINDCFNYVMGFAGDLKTDELTSTIKSAYDHNTHEAGKFAQRQSTNGNAKKQITKSGENNSAISVPATNGQQTNGQQNNGDEYIKFWSLTQDEKRLDEQGQPLLKYSLKYNRLIEFLEAAGYHRLRLPNNSYQYIRFKDNIAEPIQIINMKDHVIAWLLEKEFDGVLEMMRRGAKSYFVPQIMEGLRYKAIEFVKDTATEAFFYFKNCIVRVTKEGTTTLKYTAAQQAIWASSMIQRDFTPIDMKLPLTPDGEADEETFKKCVMAKYILLVSHSPKSKEEISLNEANQRYLSICSSIGYMLHGYKTRIAKAVIAVDHKIPEDKSEQNGGTGKSIVGESIKFLKSTTIIDGREFKEDYPFRFEMVGVDTKVVVMQDCRANLDFGSFFVPITNDFTYNRRHTGYITLPFADSPKWWFDTNFVFKGEGASFRRRMHVIEFDDFFDENHTPYDEFGHYLFQEWDDQQWNQFYNFYMYCVQLYLAEGLIQYPKSNYESRKMVSETPAEFIDFLDATGTEGEFKHKRNGWFEKKELLKAWNTEAKELSMQPTTPHLLTKWMKKYCQARPVNLFKDKTNGTEWWLLADENYKGTGKRSEKTTPPAEELPF